MLNLIFIFLFFAKPKIHRIYWKLFFNHFTSLHVEKTEATWKAKQSKVTGCFGNHPPDDCIGKAFKNHLETAHPFHLPRQSIILQMIALFHTYPPCFSGCQGNHPPDDCQVKILHRWLSYLEFLPGGCPPPDDCIGWSFKNPWRLLTLFFFFRLPRLYLTTLFCRHTKLFFQHQISKSNKSACKEMKDER